MCPEGSTNSTRDICGATGWRISERWSLKRSEYLFRPSQNHTLQEVPVPEPSQFELTFEPIEIYLLTIYHSTTNPPTGNEIERFLTAYIEVSEPQSGTGAPSFRAVQRGYDALCKNLTFRYPTFHLSPHDEMRVKALSNKHLEDGALTKEPACIRQWVGASLVRTMVFTMLEGAHESGTINWDIPLSKIDSLLLCSSLCCRSGDITKGPFDRQKLPFLCWNDIKIKLPDSTDIGRAAARVIIRNEKGHK